MKAESKSTMIKMSRPAQWAAFVGFALILIMPVLSLLFPSLRPKAAGEVSLEARFKTLPIFEHWRQHDQNAVTRHFGIGNRRVLIGREGWLYYRPDLDALSGKGPLHEEPASVAREKAKTAWQAPIPVIADFAEQLRNRGIRLLFVPVPVKPMIARAGLGLEVAPEAPELWRSTLAELERMQVEVVDLFPILREQEQGGGAFLKQDTHWTPAAMEAAARVVAQRVGTGGPAGSIRNVPAEHLGDLVGMLGLKEDRMPFERDRADLRRVELAGSVRADLFLLGDSFANLYEDSALGFGEAAGFPSHLSRTLGGRIETIAVNGGGATAVREAFGRLPATRMGELRTVVWLISARDLLLPELPARRAGIEWRALKLTESPELPAVNAGVVEITATLREISAIEDPRETPYAAAIVATLFEDEAGTERLVFLWAFRDRKLEAAADMKAGKAYWLRLVPLDSVPGAARATRLDDFFRPDLEPWFAERVEAAGN